MRIYSSLKNIEWSEDFQNFETIRLTIYVHISLIHVRISIQEFLKTRTNIGQDFLAYIRTCF